MQNGLPQHGEARILTRRRDRAQAKRITVDNKTRKGDVPREADRPLGS
jgi:hypothetical protein